MSTEAARLVYDPDGSYKELKRLTYGRYEQLKDVRIDADWSVTTGFVFGIFFAITFIIVFWAIATASKSASDAYKAMMCDYIVTV